ncbi:mitochondrial calcium uniporter regulator 1 isoform X2 [Sander vitreus]
MQIFTNGSTSLLLGGGTQALTTMVLKQCHSQLKRFGVNHPEKWYDLSFNQDRVSSFVLTAVNKSPCVRYIITPPFRNFDKLLRRGRRAGLKIRHLSAVTHMSARELSTSINAFQYLNPDVPKSEGGRLFFDTHAVVRLFEEKGFPTRQAEVMVKVLMRMTNSNMDVIYNDMVTKVLQEIMLQRVMSQIVAVKKDMVILEKSEFSTLLAESEDVMNKVRSDTVMDMHLEKSRAKALKVQHEKMLLETRAEIKEMTAEQDRHLTQTYMKIDTEVAGLKTMLEAHKLDTIKYLAGSVFTCLTVVLGFYRIWM